jgi:predicted HTH domain antitoxin
LIDEGRREEAIEEGKCEESEAKQESNVNKYLQQYCWY